MKRSFMLVGFIASLLGLADAKAQSIAPQTLNATGGSNSIGSIIFDYSIGEMVAVSTDYESNLIVTQGLLQNDISLKAAVPNTLLAKQLRVFPNPASTTVNLEYTSVLQGTLTYRLVDIAGQIITSHSEVVNIGLTREQVNVSGLAAANYLLEVSFTAEGASEEMIAYKIQKLQ